MHQSRRSRGAPSARAVSRALFATLFAALAVALVAAVPATADAKSAPAKSSHRLAPPKVSPPKKPKKSVRHKRRIATARASSCFAPLVGDWRNINPSTNAMTRALVTFTCGDLILCDIYGNCSGGDSYYSTQMFGKCSPSDCAWGRVRAYPQSGGWIRSMYYFGFKTSHVWLKPYDYYGQTYLRVWVYNDFAPSDGRADYTTDEWFLR